MKDYCDEFANTEEINNTKASSPIPEPTEDEISKAGNHNKAAKLKCEWQDKVGIYFC